MKGFLMMQNRTLLKGFFACAMTAALALGLFHLSAQPAAANPPPQCPETLLGNTFDHVAIVGDICCCIYFSPSGQPIEGPSWHC